jgi:hypothetical protein
VAISKASIETAIRTLDAAARVQFDMPARQARIDTAQGDAAVLAALSGVGFPAQVA